MTPLLTHDVFPAAWPGIGLALLVLVAFYAHRRPRWGGIALIGISLTWLLTNKTMEGGVLIVVVRGHGLTAADLAGLTGIALGGRLLLRGRL